MFTILFQQEDVVDEIKEMKEEHVVELVCFILSFIPDFFLKILKV